jgi:hypothetical protein
MALTSDVLDGPLGTPESEAVLAPFEPSGLRQI